MAGVLRGATHEVGVLTVLAVLLIPATYLLLWRTAFGLRLRSCGENPAAADSLGVPVYRMKYIAVVISGMLAGMGGVFLVFIAGIYRENQTNGRGFIGLAALIFGNWRPGGLAAGAGLFGYSDGLQLRSRSAVVSLLLLVCVVLIAVAILQFLAREAAAVDAGHRRRGGRTGRLPDHRRPAAGHRLLHPAPDDAARALAGLPTAADAAGRRARVPTRGALVGVVGTVDWDALRTAAREAMAHAYAPYSNFPVGVAGLVDDGRVVTGCNVENASYGLALCAECGMVSDLARTGGGRLVAVACVGGDGQPLMPCGRCRQLLWEHGGADMLIETVSLGIVPMREVLPDAFGPEDLVAAAERGQD